MVALLLLAMMLAAWWLAVVSYSQPHCERCAARADHEQHVELDNRGASALRPEDLDPLGHDHSGVVHRRALLARGWVGRADVVRGPLAAQSFEHAGDDPVDSLGADLGVVTREEA